ncbi:HAD family hydrolase [Phenylobacterium montanum]|uniref:HAD family hydrolase n=1 Tax=Phenylobacterium montanum TaxID=2823693 RepID=UPI00345F4039
MSKRPTGVLWDVGNVIVRWDPRTLYSKIFPDSAERERFLAEVCTPAWHIEHDRGRPMAEGVALLAAQFPEHAETIAAWNDRWWEMFSGPVAETTGAIEALAARGVPQFGLTNMSVETAPGTFAMDPAFRHLAVIVVSGEHGLIKPDPRLFALALERIGRPAESLLFVDDSAANIESAAAMGFATHHFADPAALRPALEAHGLL